METTSTCTSNDNPKKKIIVKRKVKGIVLPTRKELPPSPQTTHKRHTKPDTPQTRQKCTDDFVLQTMLTCIGNKRLLVDNIFDIVKDR